MLGSLQCRAEVFQWLALGSSLVKCIASRAGAQVATVSVLANMGAATVIFITLLVICTHPLVWQKVKAFVDGAGHSLHYPCETH